MAAIRIVDDHIELANIGSNTHAQIDTHIAAAGDYIKRDGSLALTADWDIGDTRKILADEIRARDGDGLKLYDDGGDGIFVKDGGRVGIGTLTPSQLFEIKASGSTYAVIRSSTANDAGVLFQSTVAKWVMKASSANKWVLRDIDAGADRLSIDSTGKTGIATTTPTAILDINSDILRLRTAKTPATTGAAGNQGDICWDAGYIYICTATNSWERAVIAAW